MVRTTMKDALGLNIVNAHMFALVPDQHWVLNAVTGRLRREKKNLLVDRNSGAIHGRIIVGVPHWIHHHRPQPAPRTRGTQVPAALHFAILVW